MLTDASLRRASQSLMASVAVPAVPMAAIHHRTMVLLAAQPRRVPYAMNRRAVAAMLALLAVPAMAYAVVGYETRSRESLQARGGWAPPPPPSGFAASLRAKTVTLSEAQSRAGFSLTPPAGLPAGTTLSRIAIGPEGVYDAAGHQWRTGGNIVVFRYRRAGGRTFGVTAERYDEQNLPSRYIFEDLGPDAHGNPTLVKHQRFAWSNGDQMSSATGGLDFTEREIRSMIRSMNGTELTLPWPNTRRRGTLRVLDP